MYGKNYLSLRVTDSLSLFLFYVFPPNPPTVISWQLFTLFSPYLEKCAFLDSGPHFLNCFLITVDYIRTTTFMFIFFFLLFLEFSHTITTISRISISQEPRLWTILVSHNGSCASLSLSLSLSLGEAISNYSHLIVGSRVHGILSIELI